MSNNTDCKVPVDNFRSELIGMLSEYTEEVTRGIDKAVDNAAAGMVKELKKSAPKRTGKYAKGFAKKKGDGNERIVYNKNKPQITHLLENGHAKRGGGRVKAIPHIEPAYDECVDKLQKNIEKIIENGGE